MSRRPTYEELEEKVRNCKDQLRLANDKLLVAQKYAKLGWWEFDINADKISLSDEVYEIYGITHDEEPLTIKRLMARLDPGYHGYHDRQVKRLMDAGSAVFEYPINRHDGETCWIYSKGNLRTDKDGNPTHMFGIVQDITERKLAENELRKNEEKYRQLTENIPGMVFQYILHPDGSFSVPFVSNHVHEYSGYTPQEITSDPTLIFKPIHPDDLEYVTNEIKKSSERLSMLSLEHRIIEPTGKTKWFHLKSTPKKHENGDTVWDGISIDITERKQTEDELRYTNYLLNLWMDNSPAVAFMKDLQSKITFVNGSFERLFSLSPGEIVGKTDYELYSTSPETAKQMQANDRSVIDAGRSMTLSETVMVNGQPRHFETVKFPLQNAQKEITGIAGFAIDVTDRKNAVDALLESEKRLRSIMENTGVGILLIQDDKLVYTNPKVYEMLGLSEEEFDSRDFLTFLHPEDKELAIKRIQERLVHNTPSRIPIQMRILTKSGDIRWIETNSVIMQWEGKPAVQAYINDITERKQLEEELRQAHKMEAIGNLAGGIAHEFNNVLGIIVGNAELAMDDVPDWNPAKESLKEIRNASFRAKNVVRQTLSFARKTMTALKLLEINTIVKESLKLMRASIPTMVDIQTKISPEPKMIMGDPTEIHQIVINLCTNAAHAMKASGGTLEVGITELALDKKTASRYEDLSAGDFVKLTVRDGGEGISPDILDKVFEPYFTTKKFGAGSGMGLAVVYGIVKKCKGVIKIESTVGEGTVVEVLFPKVEEEVPVKEAEQAKLPTGNERVLLVDDDPSIVNMIRQMLERLGYAVSSMTESTQALEQFNSTPDDFDLVITDMAMPKMSGDALASELIKVRKDIPILLCTGHSDTVDEKRAKQIGIKGFAMKPLDMGKLARAVRAVLDG